MPNSEERVPLVSERMRSRLAGEVLTPKEVASELKLNERTVVRHLTEGKLPGVKVGSVWRIPRARLELFLWTGEV
ncbi:DNA binding domain-containing protein, excisionase family [Terriglobus roseus]|uniref:DNA binding domain-containing protein, excisionase family n=2 Tax=Terriglobus roseus TaxID=392734 RepID=A0A1H4NSA1_9BACT|nr:DNA binding domain-containing protein, excisionase family [Terriglobus roseus]